MQAALGPLEIDRYRCLRVRHRGADCQACREACPRAAVALAPGPTVDAGLCASCGACAAVCPTGALALISPSLAEAFAACDEGALFCRRAAGGRAPLPCLAYLDAGALLLAVSRGGPTALDAGPCAACPDRAALAQVEAALAQANAVLAALGREERLRLVRERSYAGEPGVSRRQLLAWLRRPAPRARPAVVPEPWGALARGQASRAWLQPPRRRQLLAALAALGGGENQTGSPSSPRGGRPAINGRAKETKPAQAGWGSPPAPFKGASLVEPGASEPGGGAPVAPPLPFWDLSLGEACDGCGQCLTFCPTGALRAERRGREAAIVFLPEWCLGCGLCGQACPREAVTLTPATNLPEPGASFVLRSAAIARCARCGAGYPTFGGEILCPDCRQKRQLTDAIRRTLFGGRE